MPRVKSARSNRKLTADWRKEIQLQIIDKLKYRTTDDAHRQGKVPAALANVQVEKPRMTFCTGSAYKGQCDSLGFSGTGTYTYPHGAKYRGHFWDGLFQGYGCITYPNGQRLCGYWHRGMLVQHSYRFSDGLEYKANFDYCLPPDRRYHNEKRHGLKPPSAELLTNQPTKPLPKGCFDTCDGYYNPKTKIIYRGDNRILRIVSSEDEEKQIEGQYRMESDRAVGYMEGLFEYWTNGRKSEVTELENLFEREITPEETTSESFSQNSDSVYSFHIGKI